MPGLNEAMLCAVPLSECLCLPQLLRMPQSFAAGCRLGYFRFFVILGFFMIITASIIGIFLPLIESRHLIFQVQSPRLVLLFASLMATCSSLEQTNAAHQVP